MQKIKIYEILNAKQVLDELYSNKSLPTKTAYKIYLLLSKLNASLEFFNSKRIELFKKYGEQKGEETVVSDEKRLEFLEALKELTELECEEPIEKIDLDLNINLDISAADLSLIAPFFNFVE